jgi:hypothetical protein
LGFAFAPLYRNAVEPFLINFQFSPGRDAREFGKYTTKNIPSAVVFHVIFANNYDPWLFLFNLESMLTYLINK